MVEWVVGVLGGSGLYDIPDIEDSKWITVETPWGSPSDQLLRAQIAGVQFIFLPRHGRGHRLPPNAVNAKANIDSLKRAGCTDVISISAVGSLREEIAPGSFVVVDQFIDRTRRECSYFGEGLVAHVSMAEPVCERLSEFAAAAGEAAGARVVRGGTYVAIEGPQFSTRAESELYRQWGGHVIGMTAMPEAKLSREAELPYALVGMVTDYDCWRGAEEADVPKMLAQLSANVDRARSLILELARCLPEERRASPLDTVLDTALITPPEKRDAALLAKLDAVCRRVFDSQR
ncbi:S-methyl-5'-thioadenosine phosphorylase [soil metagenome]